MREGGWARWVNAEEYDLKAGCEVLVRNRPKPKVKVHACDAIGRPG